ncbi:class I SAM-dependent methyltransferase [Paludibacterium sp. B53371]|uniref:class I SAM-dependent methyltransferase n=1 Tax=Paludibacterium sp. B53371 TaxID=2806263 RepID=UPI001C040CE0|nr:methyltransferase domain-containing protein [Paludibacterium sp. B53371]
MSATQMFYHLLMEQVMRHPLPRVPEHDAVMRDPAQVHAFADSGRDQGILQPLYLYHATQCLPVLRTGDTVLDLACGPANQLACMARLNPDCHFFGLDASPAMLDLAGETLRQQQIDNVTLMQGDITNLHFLHQASQDAVMCTMSLHHLPDTRSLGQACSEIRRVLRPGGGLYLADFGRLKRLASQRYFAHDRASEQSPAFTRDFLASLRAAFSVAEMRHALQSANLETRTDQTALAPFLMIFRSTTRRQIDRPLQQRWQQAWHTLDAQAQQDFHNLVRWFRLGGLALPPGIPG